MSVSLYAISVDLVRCFCGEVTPWWLLRRDYHTRASFARVKLLQGYGRGFLLQNDVLYVPSLLVGHSCESTGECGMVKYKIQASKRLVSLHIIYLYNVTLVVHLSCYINACPAKAWFILNGRVF